MPLSCRSAVRVAMCVLVLVFVLPEPAHAYVDPSAGSIVLQVLVGGALAAAITVRRWWASAMRLLRRRRNPPSSQ